MKNDLHRHRVGQKPTLFAPGVVGLVSMEVIVDTYSTDEKYRLDCLRVECLKIALGDFAVANGKAELLSAAQKLFDFVVDAPPPPREVWVIYRHDVEDDKAYLQSALLWCEWSSSAFATVFGSLEETQSHLDRLSRFHNEKFRTAVPFRVDDQETSFGVWGRL